MKIGSSDKKANLFEKTKFIVEKTENKVINLQMLDGWIYHICKPIIFPFHYIKTGFSELIRPASVGFFLVFSLLFLFPPFMSYFNVPKTYFFIGFYLITIFPMLLVIFAVPSTYMCNGVKSNYVNFVVGELKSAGLVDSDEVELFESNVERFSKRSEARITFYRWVVGGFWAIYLILFNLSMRASAEQHSITLAYKMRDNLFSFCVILVIVLFCTVFILAYKRASELLFTALEIGSTEYKYQLLQVRREKDLENGTMQQSAQ